MTNLLNKTSVGSNASNTLDIESMLANLHDPGRQTPGTTKKIDILAAVDEND